MQAIQLKIEYLINPVGIDVEVPRFFWNCLGGTNQSAYQIIVERNASEIWNSGKVQSDQMTHIHYKGETLNSRDRVTWKVKLWDEQDASGEWESATFEMGLLNTSDWQAKWISGNYLPKKNQRYPVDCFKKQFMTLKTVQKARLYITALGLYEAKINGAKVGEFILAPGCTDYRHRLQYQVYDVLPLLSSQNILEIQLADGWYRGSIGAFGLTNVYGRQTKLLCQLEIEYADGSQGIINSDETFSWSNNGPIRFADLKDGELYDADMKPTYDQKALVVKEERRLSASNNVIVCEKEQFQPTLITTPSGAKVLDFGQNIAGYLSFNIQGSKGQKISLRCGEILDENGEFTMKNIQLKKPIHEFGTLKQVLLISGKESKIKDEMVPTPKQEITFFCSGKPDYYKTTFAIFGFRYVQIETDVAFDADQFRAIAVYSDLEQTGEFTCSNENINRFLENTRWSMKGNFLDIPSDCPTRERLGWTGDAQIFFNSAAYFMNVAPFYKKWMKDVIDGQFPNGRNSAVVPYVGIDMLYKSTGGSVGWADAIVLIPYRFWKMYGDVEIIREFYEAMRKYAMSIIKNIGMKDKKFAKANPFNQYTYEKGMHLGEWLEPEEFRDATIGMKTRHPEECTAYLHYTMTHLAEIAHELKQSEDEKLFTEYAQGAREAYDFLFLKSGSIDTDRQAKLVRPLALGLLQGDKKQSVQARLVQAVENRKYRVGTGFLSTSFVLPMLTEANRSDMAYKMLENEEAPGWLAEVKAGATTVWENWDGKDSHNHYSPGSVCEWMFNTIGGIEVSGINHFTIQVIPGGTLTFARTAYNSLYGKVTSSWEKTETGYHLEIEIPVNTTADIVLLGQEGQKVGAGKYTYEITHPMKFQHRVCL